MNTESGLVDGLYDVIKRSVQGHADKLAIICGKNTVTYSELVDLIDRVSSNLLLIATRSIFREGSAVSEQVNIHLENGENGQDIRPVRVAVCWHNSIELVVLSLAIAKLGWTLIPLNPSLRKDQLVNQVVSTGAQITVGNTNRINDLFGKSPDIVLVNWTTLFSSVGVHETIQVGQQQKKHHEEAYLIVLSSGSTGDPKPIMLSQKTKVQRARQAIASYTVSSDDVVLCASPFHHSLGQRLIFIPLISHSTLVLLEHFTAQSWLDAVESYKVTFTIAVSSHLMALRDQLISKARSISSLRCLVSSSARLNSELKDVLIEGLGCEFHEMYGATEVATLTDLNLNREQHKSSSVGKPFSDVKLYIYDDNRNTLPPREVGEIACKTPRLFSGYDGKSDQTALSMYEGCFLTGDLGYLDEDGYLYFVSRKKDIIITGGVNVVSSDVENVLIQYPFIIDCSVIAVEDAYLGEAVFAVCVLDQNTTAGSKIERLIRLFVNERLAGFQHPRGYAFIDKIPLCGSGKPNKESLRTEYREALTGDPEHAVNAR